MVFCKKRHAWHDGKETNMKRKEWLTICLSALLCCVACTPAAVAEDPASEAAQDTAMVAIQTDDTEDTAKETSSDPQDAAAASDGQKNGAKKAPSGRTAGKGKSTDAGDTTSKRTKPGDKTGASGKSGNSSGSKSNGSSSGKKSGSSSQKKGSKSQSTATASAKALTDGDELVGGTYTATGDDESALSASGTVKASVTGASIVKSAGSASSADGASFTGVNAAVRVYDSAQLTLTDCTVEASAPNATGVFAYDKGVIYLDNCTVNVTGGGAGGVQVAGGGALYGTNLTVTSASKAAIRSDRGGGVLVLDGGTYTSTGSNGCPAIYSTADITVKNAEGVSTNSRAVIIEGKNSVTLENCILSGNDQSTKEGSVKANVLLYQSASGDASVGTSVFTMVGGSMKANTGAMFYCTNTASVINLDSAELLLSEDGTLLIVSAGRWGKEGKNGGDCTLNATNQTLTGNVQVDAISSLTLNLTEGSSLTGAINGEGKVSVTLDASSAWTLTGDSYVTSIDGDLSGLDLNGFNLYVNGVAYAG